MVRVPQRVEKSSFISIKPRGCESEKNLLSIAFVPPHPGVVLDNRDFFFFFYQTLHIHTDVPDKSFFKMEKIRQ